MKVTVWVDGMIQTKVNCPIAGCGTLVDVNHLPQHLENVHEVDGEMVLRLHPTATYQHTPADDQEPEEEPAPEKESGKEPEPEKEPEPGEE